MRLITGFVRQGWMYIGAGGSENSPTLAIVDLANPNLAFSIAMQTIAALHRRLAPKIVMAGKQKQSSWDLAVIEPGSNSTEDLIATGIILAALQSVGPAALIPMVDIVDLPEHLIDAAADVEQRLNERYQPQATAECVGFHVWANEVVKGTAEALDCDAGKVLSAILNTRPGQPAVGQN